MATPSVQLLPSTLDHAHRLAPLLRAEDIAEGAALGRDASQALIRSFELSEVCYSAIFDGEVAALCGVVPGVRTHLASVDRLWMLSGRGCSKFPKAFLRSSRVVLAVLQLRYDLLSNIIDARYRGALRWAESMGAVLGAPEPHGPWGMPFRPFTVRRNNHG